MDLHLELLLTLPRHERYLVLLPPHLLTRRELVTALRADLRRHAHLTRWENRLIEAARAGGLDVGPFTAGRASTLGRWSPGEPALSGRAPAVLVERKKSGRAGVFPGDALP